MIITKSIKNMVYKRMLSLKWDQNETSQTSNNNSIDIFHQCVKACNLRQQKCNQNQKFRLLIQRVIYVHFICIYIPFKNLYISKAGTLSMLFWSFYDRKIITFS